MSYYFGWYKSFSGKVCCQRWWGEIPQPNTPIAGSVVELSAEEMDVPLSVLEAKYPFKGGENG